MDSNGSLEPVQDGPTDHVCKIEEASKEIDQLESKPLVSEDGTNGIVDSKKIDEPIFKRSRYEKLLSQCVVVFSAFWCMFFSLGISFSLGTFLPAWLEVFQEGRAKTSLIQSVHVGVLFGAGTIVGVLTEKVGLKVTMVVGSLLSSIGFLSAFFAPNITVLIGTIGVISGFGLCCVYLSGMIAVTAACSKSTSIALGFVIAGGGIGQSVMPFICDHLHNTYGWRGAFLIIAGLSLQPVIFACLMTAFLKPTQSKSGTSNNVKTNQRLVEKLKQVCHPRYIITCLVTSIAFAETNGFLFILFDFAIQRQGDGIFFIFLITTTSTVCNIICGIVSRHPRISSSVLLSVSVMLGSSSIILLGVTNSYTETLVFMVTFGVAYGGLIAIAGIVILDLVGKEVYPLGIGINVTINGIASSVGGIIYGLLYDLTQTYTISLLSMGTVTLVVGTLPIVALVISQRLFYHQREKGRT
ncbi:hypothetical protein LOTGIDRAFT_157086 [Lottia gigantea]|uniref:Major facilitator superfamily (MFS) profile domain-containing protein n=1 Tax=Lottia gigantea TaxID=225164 RepID=V4B8B6_LOTGI|nr:hypothetical protein LOTGIDRAFT_157086 [Lottia gigantea]ESP01957.1 hypothetical protein LOTGIDRAFT_157086 [Lottia gigantea]